MTLAALYPSEIIGESFRLRKLTNVARSSPKQPSDQFIRVSEKHIHRPHNKDEAMENSCIDLGRTFADRFSDALRRRLAPNTNLTAQQLAGALGVSDTTIKNLLRRANEPSARVIDGCISMFRDSFINEIYGCHNVHCIDTRAEKKAAALRRMIEAQEELRRLG